MSDFDDYAAYCLREGLPVSDNSPGWKLWQSAVRDGYPEGVTPADVRAQKEANFQMAQRIAFLERENARQTAGVPADWREAVQRAYDELSIIDGSEGIAGFHLNGAVSPWGEGELPNVREELGDLLNAALRTEGDSHG